MCSRSHDIAEARGIARLLAGVLEDKLARVLVPDADADGLAGIEALGDFRIAAERWDREAGR